MSTQLISHSPEETEELGEEWGRTAVPGLVIALTGDLGAGKTRLVKGVARGLGSQARVHSPTFALLNLYEDGRLPLYHLDLYRLENPEQVMAAGLDVYLPSPGVTVVEWAERWFGSSPFDRDGSISSPSAPPTHRGEDVPSPSLADLAKCLSEPALTPAGLEARGLSRLLWVRLEVLSESRRRIEAGNFGKK